MTNLSASHHQVEVLPASLVLSAISPNLTDGSRCLHLGGAREGGMLEGAVAFPLVWSSGRHEGAGYLRVTPFSTWMTEIEINLERPSGAKGRLLFDRQKLEMLAREFGATVRRELELVFKEPVPFEALLESALEAAG